MRYQFIDRLTELVPQQRAIAETTFRADADFFRDHFPGFPIVPGALLTEAMSQTAGWLIAASLDFTRWPLLSMVQSAKFRRFVTPGQSLAIEAVIDTLESNSCTARARISRDEERIAEATLAFQIFDPSIAGAGAGAFSSWTRATFDAIAGTALLTRGTP